MSDFPKYLHPNWFPVLSEHPQQPAVGAGYHQGFLPAPEEEDHRHDDVPP